MIKGKKVVVVVPAGRKEQLQILIPYLKRDMGLIDEIHLWKNTSIRSDLDFIESIKDIKIITPDRICPGVDYFYQFLTEEETVYIKCDDDICFIEQGAIEELVQYRIDNLNPFLIYPNIINNVIMTFIHQQIGCLTGLPVCSYHSHCENGLSNSKIAIEIHQRFFDRYEEKSLDQYKFKKWLLYDFIRCSINFIVFFGKDIKKYDGRTNDELSLSSNIPLNLNRPNEIYGSKIVSHLSYGPQRPMRHENAILASYQEILKREQNGTI